jgi:hypothetical protein
MTEEERADWLRLYPPRTAAEAEETAPGDEGCSRYSPSMRLRHGVTVEMAIRALEERISASQQASARNSTGPEWVRTMTPDAWEAVMRVDAAWQDVAPVVHAFLANGT